MKEYEKRIIAYTSSIFNMLNDFPIIYYHDIVPDKQGFSYQKTEVSLFMEQIKYIAENGYNTYTFYDLQQKSSLAEKKALLICFDDGYLSNYEIAFPIFAKYNIKFNIFIEGRAIFQHKDNYMTENHIRRLKESGLVGIGAHTWSHFDCLTLSDSSFETEILKENDYLCSILHEDRITDFCFPYGNYDEKVLNYLDQKKVYDRLYTSDNIRAKQLEYSTVYGRIAIENNDMLPYFKYKIDGKFGSYILFKKIKRKMSDD